MGFAAPKGVTLHFRLTEGRGRPVVFLNSLGTDLRIWDEVVARLVDPPPILAMDKRGHGLSNDAPINMDLLVGDVADLMDDLGLVGALVCGVSVGGMIAQGLASMRPDLVAGLLLCNTGTRIGDSASWSARIDAVAATGIAPMADGILERWFSPGFRTQEPAMLDGYRNMLIRTSAAGYAGVCVAIRDTDLAEATARLRVPVTCIAGSADLATPPALVRTLAAMIPQAEYHLIEGVGHIPSIEAPAEIAAQIEALRGRIA